MRPSDVYNMPPGEKLLVRAFFEHEREEFNRLAGKVMVVLPVM
jgi:hypothetical protein